MPPVYNDKWKELGPAYMTEESDDLGDKDVVIVRKLPWRLHGE